LIRLEKGSCSYMNRSIMSKGAFAILYGQHMKYYIREPEVILSNEFVNLHCIILPKIFKIHVLLDWPHDNSIIRSVMRTFQKLIV
jgi:hypothetical protein